jgi:hypothetical protein
VGVGVGVDELVEEKEHNVGLIEGQTWGGPVFSKIHSEFLQVVVDVVGFGRLAVCPMLPCWSGAVAE